MASIFLLASSSTTFLIISAWLDVWLTGIGDRISISTLKVSGVMTGITS
jgi:hypothetical protein